MTIEDLLRALDIVPSDSAGDGPHVATYNSEAFSRHLRFNLGLLGLDHDAVEVAELLEKDA